MTTSPDNPLYLEDLHIGRKFTSGTYVMDTERMRAFAAEFDPQPFHLDENAARGTVFGGLAASGWHTASAAMSLLVKGGLKPANGIVGLGVELSWPRPARPGDVLRLESEVVEIIPSSSKPHLGVVTIESTMLNQKDEIVYRMTSKILVPRRPA